MKKYLAYFPVALLVIVAFHQLYLTHTNAYLNPDKGGGFGMFATVDKLNNRSLMVYALIDNQKFPVNINQKSALYEEQLKYDWMNARSNPTYKNLRRLSKKIMSVQGMSRTPEYLMIEVSA
jgi:hypothetical protein